MKRSIFKILVIIFISTTSCTDVVDVDVPEAAPRLVVEASIDWEKSAQGNEQSIKLSTSTPYFDNLSNTSVTDASVKITNNASNEEFVFVHQGDGIYSTSSFVPVLNQEYTLEINYQGETYIAEESMTPVVDIDELSQARVGGFNDDALEVDIYFNDPPNEENFYLFRFEEEGDLLPELLAIPDEFTDGNRMKVFFEKEEDEDIGQEEFEPGDIAHIEFYGISKQYFNYIDLLIDQYENADNPFGTVPATLKGNVVNPSNPENYAFGYFRLTQVNKATYVFQ
ncbi:DUF4249 domain-containing protein [Hyunsoonleella flava]|uniref:DUF4249 domain-containing protein n=1 Tax=Hyunsoonleella flava TaxID=2527939 RepID=A0A4V2JAH6_9FLAO|nr:DUF4249 domain-containing protein [Hyunsoonleella flava]TBN06326.1 DUF4249 domain-containing protein [Hyunsoonleella flava]